MEKKPLKWGALLSTALVSSFVLGAGIGAGGCGTTAATGENPGGGTTLTLSGQAAVRSTDVAGLRVGALSLKNQLLGFRPKFATIGDTALADATVTLVKINADGTETTVSGVSTTTDSDGNYTLSDVPATSTGSGDSTDFYYEVRVSNGTGYVAAPVAAADDATVNVSPETNLAATMLMDVAQTDATGASHLIPSEESINDLREAALDEVSGTLYGKVSIPDATDADQTVIAATALSSDGGDIEKAMEAVEAQKNYLALDASDDAAEIASYLANTTKSACNYNSNLVLPQSALDTLADLFTANTTVTMSELVAAFNTSNGSDPDVTSDSAVTALDTMLGNIDTALVGDTSIADADSVAAFVKRDLTASTFDSTTPLEIDQALAFVQTLFPTDCQNSNFDLIKFANELGGSDVTASSEVIDAQIYNNSTGACTGGTPGHLQATVRVYAADGLTTSGVVLTGGSSPVTLSVGTTVGNISTWTVTGVHCLALPSDVAYTVTATMDDASTVTLSKTVPHRSVDEASISLVNSDGSETAFTADSTVYKVPVVRPTFKWTPAPGTPTTESVNGDVPENTKIKFIFELAYAFTDSFLSAHSATSSPISQCGTGGSGNKLMDKNYFVSDTDCDIAACVAALHTAGTVHLSSGDISTSGIATTDVICRTNIQTFLVDDDDNIIGQAAGNFRKYCLDADVDGSCD